MGEEGQIKGSKNKFNKFGNQETLFTLLYLYAGKTIVWI